MNEMLKRLMARRQEAARKREEVLAKRKAITDLATDEKREELSEEEDTEFRNLTHELESMDKDLGSMDERIAELSEEEERSRNLTAGAEALKRAQARIESIKESLTYQKGDNSRSYMRDLVRHSLRLDGDEDAADRLRRHAVDVRTAPEYRDLTRTDGAGGYFVPPAWLMSQYIELARAGRPTANLVQNQPLPSGTDSINIPIVSTGTATAIQTADNGSVQETDLADSSVVAQVRTIAGQQDLAIQLLDQSPVNFDEVIFRDLTADYATKVDAQVISGLGSSGQVKGLLSASNTIGVTYTDTSPTVQELYSKLADAVQQMHTGRFRPPTVIVMHPRRWAWFLTALDSQNRPLVVPNGYGPNNAMGILSAVDSQQVVGSVHGLPVVTDPTIPTNLGSGTNEDRIFVLKADDSILWESSIRTRVLPDVGSGNLTVRLQVYGYLAFSAERYPKGTAIVSGTGLVAPSF